MALIAHATTTHNRQHILISPITPYPSDYPHSLYFKSDAEVVRGRKGQGPLHPPLRRQVQGHARTIIQETAPNTAHRNPSSAVLPQALLLLSHPHHRSRRALLRLTSPRRNIPPPPGRKGSHPRPRPIGQRRPHPRNQNPVPE